jgi:hypothetical protein
MSTTLYGYLFGNNDLGKIAEILSGGGGGGLNNTVLKQSFAVAPSLGNPSADISALSGKRILGLFIIYDAGGGILGQNELSGVTATDPDDQAFLTHLVTVGDTTAYMPELNMRFNSPSIVLNFNGGSLAANITVYYCD